ncbi:MAG: DNA polymerase III subunit delta [Pseudomonadota bacterium]
MTALKGKAIKSFLARRDPAFAAVLLYGPDGGLAKERADGLARGVVADFKDPFNYLELADSDIKAEPGRLADEAAALSFAGGERVVRLRTSGDIAATAATTLLKGLDEGYIKANALILIEAGDLTPRSGLRKAFEKSKRGASLPCYRDGPGDIRQVAIDAASEEALTFDKEALDLLSASLTGDRGLARAEIEKLVLYKGPKSLRNGPATITLEDARACLVDGVGDAVYDAADACTDGSPSRAATALHKAGTAGASPISTLRALQRALSRLATAQEMMADGASAAAAMKKLRPPVFFSEERAFEARLRRWSQGRLENAIRMLMDVELDAKKTGAPQKELIERAALRVAMMGRR